jgi:hypothetical protein
MVTFRVKPRFQTRRKLSDSDGTQGRPRLARIGGQVNRNLEVISWPPSVLIGGARLKIVGNWLQVMG